MKKHKTVDAYIADAPEEAAQLLSELRRLVKATIPDATESISYDVPFYTFNGTHVGFDVSTKHVTFGIGSDVLTKAVREELALKGYKTGTQTIQIKFDQDVPTTILKQLLKAKLQAAKKQAK